LTTRLNHLPTNFRAASFVFLLAFAALSIGCAKPPGPETAYVSGVVTLDGTPVPNAVINFTPANGRPSVGFTDANGEYELIYTASRQGALLGEHTVRIKSAESSGGGEGNAPKIAASKESIPAKYNTKTELTAQVESGSNTIDFELKSK